MVGGVKVWAGGGLDRSYRRVGWGKERVGWGCRRVGGENREAEGWMGL